MIFGLFVHPGTQTFFFGSSTRSAVRQILHPTMEKTRRKMKKMWKKTTIPLHVASGSGGVSLQQRAAGKDFWQSNFAKRLAFGSACKRPFLSFGRGICE